MPALSEAWPASGPLETLTCTLPQQILICGWFFLSLLCFASSLSDGPTQLLPFPFLTAGDTQQSLQIGPVEPCSSALRSDSSLLSLKGGGFTAQLSPNVLFIALSLISLTPYILGVRREGSGPAHQFSNTSFEISA